jgi:hypothetical protein
MELVHLFLTVKVTSKEGEAAELQQKGDPFVHTRQTPCLKYLARERESRECEGK